MSKEIEELLKQIYPDITPETINSVSAERRKQYNRDFETIAKNFEEFNEKLSSGNDVSNALFKVKLSKYMDKLFPGYKNMSLARQEECEYRFGLTNLNMTEIDVIYEKITDPEDPMYRPGLSEKDAAHIAAIYASFYKDSKKLIGHPTGRTVHDPNDWFTPIDEIKYFKPTEQEQIKTISDAVSEYNKKNRFNIKNILTGVKKYNITIETALQARDYLNAALSPQSQKTAISSKSEIGEEK